MPMPHVLQGKIVFCAPTKPLLNQQVKACYEKMSVSKVQPDNLLSNLFNHSHLRPATYVWFKRVSPCEPGHEKQSHVGQV